MVKVAINKENKKPYIDAAEMYSLIDDLEVYISSLKLQLREALLVKPEEPNTTKPETPKK